MPDSLNLIPQTQNYRGVCEPLGQNALDCMIWGNLVGLLIEDIHSWYPFYVEQEITANWYGSDYSGDFRIERLVWFFFTWVQIDLVNENGLQGDDV